MSPLAGSLGPLGVSRAPSGPPPEYWSYTAAGGVASNQSYGGGSYPNELIVGSGKTLTISAVAIFVSNAGASNGASCHLLIWRMSDSTKILDEDFSSSGSGSWALVAGTFRAKELGTPLVLTAGTYRIGVYGTVDNWNSGGSITGVFAADTYGGNVSYGAASYGGGLTSVPNGGLPDNPNPYLMGAIVRGSIA